LPTLKTTLLKTLKELAAIPARKRISQRIDKLLGQALVVE
jgi:acetyl-CoA carboxylase carboxyl transferase subunit alpha